MSTKISFSTDPLLGRALGNPDKGAYYLTDSTPGLAHWYRDDAGKPTTLEFVCPCGCGMVCAVPVGGAHGWSFDGNEQQPTLSPSIQLRGACQWHGFLVAGEWRTC